MAQFVSQYTKYSHGVREEAPERLGPKGVIPAVTALEAVFSHSLMTPEAIVIAKKTTEEGGLANPDPTKPPFHGMQINEGGREYDVSPRLALFDSEKAQLANGWTDEDRIEVEEQLRASPYNGRHFVEVVPEPVDKPWPGYDDIEDPDRVLDLAIAIDADLSKIIAYERQNLARPELLMLLEEAQSERESETIVVA